MSACLQAVALCDLEAPGWGEPWFPHCASVASWLTDCLLFRFSSLLVFSNAGFCFCSFCVFVCFVLFLSFWCLFFVLHDFFLSEPVAFRRVYGLDSSRGLAGNRTTTGSLSATQECRDTN